MTIYFVKSGSTMQQPLDGDSMTQGTTAGSDTDVGIYVLESTADSEYTLSKEELALVDMEDFYIELRARTAPAKPTWRILSPSNGRTAASTR